MTAPFAEGDYLRIPWWPTSRPASGENGKAIAEAASNGTVPRLEGLVGSAPFPMVGENGNGLCFANFITSTAPLQLINHPALGGAELIAEYVELREGVFLSVNYADDPSFLDVLPCLNGLPSFVGDFVFFTIVPQLLDIMVTGPSLGLAALLSSSGYISPIVSSGQVAASPAASVYVVPVQFTPGKLAMCAQMGLQLMTVISDELVGFVEQNRVSFQSPLESVYGLHSNKQLLLVGDAASALAIVRTIRGKGISSVPKPTFVKQGEMRQPKAPKAEQAVGTATDILGPENMWNDTMTQSIVPGMTVQDMYGKVNKVIQSSGFRDAEAKALKSYAPVVGFWHSDQELAGLIQWFSANRGRLTQPVPLGLGMNDTSVNGKLRATFLDRDDPAKLASHIAKLKAIRDQLDRQNVAAPAEGALSKNQRRKQKAKQKADEKFGADVMAARRTVVKRPVVVAMTEVSAAMGKRLRGMLSRPDISGSDREVVQAALDSGQMVISTYQGLVAKYPMFGGKQVYQGKPEQPKLKEEEGVEMFELPDNMLINLDDD